jgi:hypothetical protein
LAIFALKPAQILRYCRYAQARKLHKVCAKPRSFFKNGAWPELSYHDACEGRLPIEFYSRVNQENHSTK